MNIYTANNKKLIRKGVLIMAKDERFVKAYSQGLSNISEIWVDTITGVNYYFHAGGAAGGMTPLLDANGNVVITPPEENKWLKEK